MNIGSEMNLGERRVEGLWSIAMIELTNYCNFKCSFCPSDVMTRGKTVMARALWEKVLKEIGEKKLAYTVFFHVVGEPLLHKDIFKAIRFANDLGLSVSLYTNAALLDETRSKRLLVALKKGRVVLSIQEINPESFQARSRGTLTWEQYNQNLLNFIRMNERQADAIQIQIHCMLDLQKMGWNIRQIIHERNRLQTVYEQWQRSLGVQCKSRINVLNPTASYPLTEKCSFFVKNAGNWDNQLFDNSLKVVEKHRGHCALVTDTFAVLSDGTCTYCCDDYEGKLNLGNASENSLENIFYGEKAANIRQAEKQGQFIEKRCRQCRGTLVDKKTQKSVSSHSILTDYYIFNDHLSRYGLKSSIRKALGVLNRRFSG